MKRIPTTAKYLYFPFDEHKTHEIAIEHLRRDYSPDIAHRGHSADVMKKGPKSDNML